MLNKWGKKVLQLTKQYILYMQKMKILYSHWLVNQDFYPLISLIFLSLLARNTFPFVLSNIWSPMRWKMHRWIIIFFFTNFAVTVATASIVFSGIFIVTLLGVMIQGQWGSMSECIRLSLRRLNVLLLLWFKFLILSSRLWKLTVVFLNLWLISWFFLTQIVMTASSIVLQWNRSLFMWK